QRRGQKISAPICQPTKACRHEAPELIDHMLRQPTLTAYVADPSPSREGLDLIRRFRSRDLLALAATIIPGLVVAEAGVGSLAVVNLTDQELARREWAIA